MSAARTQLGVPYSLGSAAGRSVWDAGRQLAFDCSGFVAWAFSQATGGAVQLPAFTDALASSSQLRPTSTPQAGDVILYRFTDSGQPGVTYPHTAIYEGKGMQIQAGDAYGQKGYVNESPVAADLNPQYFQVLASGSAGASAPAMPTSGAAGAVGAGLGTGAPAPPAGGDTTLDFPSSVVFLATRVGLFVVALALLLLGGYLLANRSIVLPRAPGGK